MKSVRAKANLGGAPVQVVVAPLDGTTPWNVPDATFTNCLFHWDAGGREKFLSGHPNLHAWVVGDVAPYVQPDDEWVRVRYNPAIHHGFVDLRGRIVLGGDVVTIRVYNGKAKTYVKGAKYADEESD